MISITDTFICEKCGVSLDAEQLNIVPDSTGNYLDPLCPVCGNGYMTPASLCDLCGEPGIDLITDLDGKRVHPTCYCLKYLDMSHRNAKGNLCIRLADKGVNNPQTYIDEAVEIFFKGDMK